VSPAATPEKPVKVIYVMGSGHSGSTILGVALGNCQGVFFAGEMNRYLTRSGMPVLGGLERTRFWASVREQVPQAEPLFGEGAHELLERSSAALRPDRARAADALRARYREVTASLFGAVAATADAQYVVDTSHFPLRARELQQTPGVELHLIFLVRDAEPVVSSIMRLVSRHDIARRRVMTLRTSADLWLTYALSLRVFMGQPEQRRLLVRYEDLVAAPEAVLAAVLAHFGSQAAVPDLGALRTGLAIHANRLIDSEVVAMKRAPAAAQRAATGGPTHRSSPATALVQRPWNAVFERLSPAAGRGGRAGARSPA